MIFIVEGDNAGRDWIRFLLECEGLEAEDFQLAESFLNGHPAEDDGCAIVDVDMSGMSRLDLLESLPSNGNSLPTIVVVGLSSTAVRARAGADFPNSRSTAKGFWI